MKQRFFTVAILFFLFVFFAACKKNNTAAPVLKTYLARITESGYGTYTWIYDGQNRLQSIAFVSLDEAKNLSYTFRISAFDASGNVADFRYDYADPANSIRRQSTFNADGKLVLQKLTKVSTGELMSTATADYSSGKVTVTYKNQSGITQSAYSYTLSADQKNVIELKISNGTGTLVGTYAYSGFTDKISPYSFYPSGVFISPVNVNVFSTDLYTPASGSPVTYTYTYEYNSDGYVTKSTFSTGSILTYDYVKK